MSWLNEHLDKFVRPVLGDQTPSTKLPADYKRFFSPGEMSVIKNMWRSLKCQADGKPILLAGRDVFVFEILARREGFPTTFRPAISRLTVNHIKEDYSGYFLFDTGFAGSIPRGLRSNHFTMVSSNLVGMIQPFSFILRGKRGTPLKEDIKQIFPRLTGSRSLALKIERTPKYWKRGFVDEGYRICQELSPETEFLAAARLTVEIYTDSSPRFSERVDVRTRSAKINWDID